MPWRTPQLCGAVCSNSIAACQSAGADAHGGEGPLAAGEADAEDTSSSERAESTPGSAGLRRRQCCEESSDLYDSLGEGDPLLDWEAATSRKQRVGGRQLQQRSQGLVNELGRRQERFNTRQRSLAGTVNAQLKSQWLAQQERIVARSRQMTAKLNTGRSRAWRHKWIFALVQADFIASAFWLGKSPETYYWYYTAQIAVVFLCRFIDYGWHGQHYFLLDFCYFANFCVLLWIWVFPASGPCHNAAAGVCGLLAISIAVFRNSCVPHDFVRITNACVHYGALVCMMSVHFKCEGDVCVGMRRGAEKLWQERLRDAWSAYALWALVYASIIFLFARNRIIRKKRGTLYNYFANTLNYRERLPPLLKPFPELIFMLSHATMFSVGVWWLFLPAALQAILTVAALFVFLHNGGRFYVEHFWKAYERNTAQYVDAALSVLNDAEEAERCAAVGTGVGCLSTAVGTAWRCVPDCDAASRDASLAGAAALPS